MTTPPIPADRLALLDAAVLTHGAHERRSGTCARELLHLVTEGQKADATPGCLTIHCGLLPELNDGPWHDDAHRTQVMMPFVRRLLDCPRDDAADLRKTFRLVDYVVRTALPEAYQASDPDLAECLRGLLPIEDTASVRTALAHIARARDALTIDARARDTLALALALDTRTALAHIARARDTLALALALDTRTLALALARARALDALARTRDLDTLARGAAWEQHAVAVLTIITTSVKGDAT